MKTLLVSTLAAAGLALSLSSAFAFSNSPQGQVITGGEAPAVTSQDYGYDRAAPAPQGRFLSGEVQDQPRYDNDGAGRDFGLSSNAVQGRDFLNAQKGRY